MRINSTKQRAKRNGESLRNSTAGPQDPPVIGRRAAPVLITGGAGFIGTNVAHRYLSAGQPVLLFDNFSRPGVEKNLDFLQKAHGPLLRIEHSDVRDARA